MISFASFFDIERIRSILIICIALMLMVFILVRFGGGFWAITIRNYYIAASFLLVGAASILTIGIIDFHSVLSTIKVLIPAIIVMGIIGQLIGYIMDNPKNREDADYKLSVLNALKNIDKDMTLEDLNEKLTKTIEEPDATDESIEENIES